MPEKTYLERMEEAKRLICEAHDLVVPDGDVVDMRYKLSDALARVLSDALVRANSVIQEEREALEAENKLTAN
ncbi:hypothetical protein [Sulfitobacter sp. R18_1]|uniref:hypothetical protein n=1 Tax=Sulfitobacter sp. R18_1 TaxID=2821104 RepID=UPI001ADAA960|nr:hypothetical protein [Sulfitobacter sp. R18_1]MBO9428187.1 hypothetical protein [Sulfitobacter sp. R18_1]